jgi:hypothetical protein
VIFNTVLVLEYVIFQGEKVGPAQPQLSVMADNYPADWCINRNESFSISTIVVEHKINDLGIHTPLTPTPKPSIWCSKIHSLYLNTDLSYCNQEEPFLHPCHN